MPKVIVTRRWPEQAEANLREKYDVVLNEDDHVFSQDELASAVASADALCPTVTDAISADLFGPGMRVKIIGSFGVGFDHVDLEAARGHGVAVTNTPDVLTECTADLAMTLLLSCARRTSEGERQLRRGDWTGWRPTHLVGSRVWGKTLAIVGMGRIGVAMARRAHHGFGMRIVCYDLYDVAPDILRELDAQQVASVDELLPIADFVSLHCPATAENHHLMNAARIGAMQPTAFLINSARGPIVDEQALCDALRAQRIAGAGLDVYEAEPIVLAGLMHLENVVLAPHLGSATLETREAMGLRVIENLDRFFAGERPPDLCT